MQMELAASVSPSRPVRVLVCDDQPDVLEAMRLLLKGEGFQAITVDSPKALLHAAQAEAFDLILADLNYTRDTTSGEEGLELLAGLDAMGNRAPIVVMTAWGSVDLAVEAMRRGACDFIQKPWDNQKVISVVRKQAEGERKRKSELEIAANVQQKLFPRTLQPRATLDYAGRCVAAREVGGDYYDFIEVDDATMGFAIGDVSGKGIPAALLMANLQACFRSQPPTALLAPAKMLETVNRHFYDSTAVERFATVFFAVYNDRTGVLRYANCGHLPPLLLRSTGEVEKLGPTATMLGAFRNWHCGESVVDLRTGDELVLYSDGVTEAGGEQGEDFGEARVIETMRRTQSASAMAVTDAILEDVLHFSGGARADDITAVTIRSI